MGSRKCLPDGGSEDPRSRAQVVRPSIPPVAWLALGLVGGVCVAERIAWWRFSSGVGVLVSRDVIALGFFAILSLAWLLLSRGNPSSRPLFGLAVLTGLILGLMCIHAWAETCEELEACSATSWVVEAITDPAEGEFGSSSVVRVVDTGAAGRIQGARLLALWPEEATPPEAGQVVTVVGGVRAIESAEGARARERLRRGVCGSLRVRRVTSTRSAASLRGRMGPLRAWCRARTKRVEGAAGALLDGIVLGDRRRLSGTDAERAFKVTGLTHLVAVSGGHLVVVAASVAYLAGALGARRVPRALLVAGVTGAYVVFSGVQVSAVRAWIMALVVAATGLSGRRGDSVGALALTAVAMIILSPLAVFDVGFQLSALSVVGLLLLARLASVWLTAALPPCLETIAAAVSMTLVAQAATLPVTTRLFGQASLVSPIANLLVGPLVSLGLLGGLVGLCLSFVLPPLGAIVLTATGAVLGAAARIAGSLAGLPNAAVPSTPAVVALVSGLALLAALTWIRWPLPGSPQGARRTVVLIAAVCLLVAVGPPLSREALVTVLDVGQGDAILIRDGPAALLVDTGPAGSAMKSAIARTGVKRLDCVVLTHPHRDHTGGLEALSEITRIGAVYRSAAEDAHESPGSGNGGSPRRTHAAMETRLDAGDRISLGRWRLQVLWPEESNASRTSDQTSANEASVVMLASCGSFDVLLTGDAEREILDQLLANGSLRDIDVLKVGHHGSKVAVDEGVVEVLRPEYSVVSVGEGNRFGHPTREALELLTGGGSRVLRTDSDGDVTFRVSAAGYTVSTKR